MDPLLNTGILWRCLAAYAGIQSDSEPPHDEISTATMTTTDTSSEKRRKSDPDNSPSPMESEGKQTFEDPEHMREDTYYARLSKQSFP